MKAECSESEHIAAKPATVMNSVPAQIDMLLSTVNAAHDVFRNRHNWLSPLTSDEERKDFVTAVCDWWNTVVCPSMDRIGAAWNERRQRFELPMNCE